MMRTVTAGQPAPGPVDWRPFALCAQTDPEAFFPEVGDSARDAKRICSGCEVRAECLDYALTYNERFGVWGGLSASERRLLRRAAARRSVTEFIDLLSDGDAVAVAA